MVRVVVGNKFDSKGMSLTYVPPVIKDNELVLHLLKKDIDVEPENWNKALILYIVVNTPTCY